MNPPEAQNYDSFSGNYDRFVNWQNRLEFELPFLLKKISEAGLRQPGNHRVLDAACGTGMHAVALAQKGYQLSGSDLSAGMIERARQNAQETGASIRFETAGFGELAQTFGQESFDSLLCLGNSLPHLLSRAQRIAALSDFANSLVPQGLLIMQNRNFDAVMASRERTMDPVSYFDQDKEWLFLRFYEYLSDGLINFNIVTLYREGRSSWTQTMTTTQLLPLLRNDLLVDLSEAGFINVECFGGLNGNPYDPAASSNLVVTARKA
jgi:glycine/sarcosine N-methyltransferase